MIKRIAIAAIFAVAASAAFGEIPRDQWPIAAATRVLSAWTATGLRESVGHRDIIIISDTEARQGTAVFLQTNDDPCAYQVRFADSRNVFQLRFDQLVNEYTIGRGNLSTESMYLRGSRKAFCIWVEPADAFFRSAAEISSTPPQGSKVECRDNYGVSYAAVVERALRFMADRCPPKELEPY